MAAQLEGPLRVRPHLDDVPTLFRVLYQLARRQKVLVVVDEFPYLLGTTTQEQQTASVIAADLRMESNQTPKYLGVLESLQLVTKRLPVGARSDARSSQWKCDDHFVRFWFRFIQPYQDLLEAGTDPRAHVDNIVAPQLPDHTAPVFEEVLADWVRRRHEGKASSIGGWWGPALNARRAEKSRFTEEIDTVAVSGRTVLAACEAKWTTKPLASSVLTSLLEHKLPALAGSGFDVSKAEIILASRSGFTDGLRTLAPEHPNVVLVEAKDMLGW